jgi:NAD(P)-dependent dehydrogenase (short-subunit alcohol dehydrogenase family)
MGAATAQLLLDLGARVVVADFAKVQIEGVTPLHINLSEKHSIDEAIQNVAGPIHAVFFCAGVADGTAGIERINFIGHRYLLETLVDRGLMPHGSAACFIASSAGLGWEPIYTKLAPALDIKDFDEASKWFVANEMASYVGTKRILCAYIAREAYSFLKRGIRINASCPGPTDTPLAERAGWSRGGADFRADIGIERSSPLEQAYPLVFLCSEAASAISGVTLVADAGWFNAGFMRTFPAATPMAKMILGRELPQ